jgi:hypothetical protein
METIRIGHMIGPPCLKLWTKKFLSNSLSGEPAGAALGLVAAAGAGDVVTGMPFAGAVPGAMLVAGAAGLVAVPGAPAFGGTLVAGAGGT